MMTITAIMPERKKLSSVFIDGEFAMKLDSTVLAENGIIPGTDLDDEQLHELIEKSDYKRAKEKALWLLSGHDYSRRKLIEKLRRETPEETADAVCDRLEELGLLDDEKYARRLADDLIHIKKLSPRGALYKMMEKGIDRDLAQEILDEFETDPVEQISQLIEQKYAGRLGDEKGMRRTIAAFQRMGYSWSDIRSALAQWEDE